MEAARKKKRALPEWYKDQPPQPAGCQFFYEAFRDLTTERRYEGGPIPWGAAMAYAGRKHLEEDVAEAMWTVVRLMDVAERRWRVEQMEEGGDG